MPHVYAGQTPLPPYDLDLQEDISTSFQDPASVPGAWWTRREDTEEINNHDSVGSYLLNVYHSLP